MKKFGINMDQRWNIWLDVEGFSNEIGETTYASPYNPLNAVILGLAIIGEECVGTDEASLFIRQIGGDGFLISSRYGNWRLNLALEISISMMRLALIHGGTAKISIALGNMADIKGCLPEELDAYFGRNGDLVHLKSGSVHLFSIMGRGLINSFKGAEKRSGPRLILDNAFAELMDESLRSQLKLKKLNSHWEVDWIHTNFPSANSTLNCILFWSPTKPSRLNKRQIEENVTEFLPNPGPDLIAKAKRIETQAKASRLEEEERVKQYAASYVPWLNQVPNGPKLQDLPQVGFYKGRMREYIESREHLSEDWKSSAIELIAGF